MAMLVAPYHSAMRLGSGFNSYTQSLCIDNAVIRESPFPAKDDHELAGNDLKDEPEVAQSVIFKTEIIDKTTDLTDSLDIRGALNIKASNIANAHGSGSFVNSSVIAESDLNFLITCKVVNQIIHDNSLTKFNPLSSSNPSNFTDIFGDCFISGFQVGGEFTALISIKIHDKTQLNSILADANAAFTSPNFLTKENPPKAEADKPTGGSAESEGHARNTGEKSAVTSAPKATDDKAVAQKPPAAPGKGLSLDVDGKIQKSRTDIMSQNTVTISVAYAGGGQQLKNQADDWNFDTLRAAAIKFPELVAKTPVRTHAVLTKYNSLRSYHNATSKTSTVSAPASYENAGVHTNMLQEAYLDYKNLYKDLQLLGVEVDAGRMTLQLGSALKSDEKSELSDDEPKLDVAQNDQVSALSEPAGEDAQTPATDTSGDLGTVSAPADVPAKLPKKPLKPPFTRKDAYPASLMGIELAKRDIRLNMSRIVQEVDEVAKDPALVSDEDRTLSFMSPLLFKQFLPKQKQSST